MRKQYQSIFYLLIILTVYFTLVSCSGKPPQLNYVYANPLYRMDQLKEEKTQSLVLFLEVFDEDGAGDLEFIYLIHDKQQLYWTINSDNWTTRKINEIQWIGCNSIVMPDRGTFPEGEYRVQIVDKAGDRDESFFVLDKTQFMANLSFPVLDLGEEGISAKAGAYPSSMLFYVDAADVIKRKKDFTKKEISYAEILPNLDMRPQSRYYLMAYVAENGAIIMNGPFILIE